MPLNQDSRLLAITTALGPNVLAVRSIPIQEQISRLFQIDAELSSRNNKLQFGKVGNHKNQVASFRFHSAKRSLDVALLTGRNVAVEEVCRNREENCV